MRNQWRLLIQRCKPSSQVQLVRHGSSSNSSLPHSHFKVQSSCPLSHGCFYSFPHSIASDTCQNPNFRRFSSSPELTVEENKHSDQAATSTLIDLFCNPKKSNEDVMLEISSKNILVADEFVTKLVKSRGSNPDVARKFFDWVMEKGGDNLSSNSCNWILGMLGENALLKEFWDLVDIMEKKGYGVKKGASVRAMKKFEEEGLESEVQKLKDLFASGSVDRSIEKVSSIVCKVIRQDLWGGNVEKKLQELGVEYSSDLIEAVLEKLGSNPSKAVIFFRWIEESGLFKHDQKTYNAMARVLAREDYIDRFWKVIDEMRAAGYDMEKTTYIGVVNQFLKRKMLNDAVDLYEFAMGGTNKPSVTDCPLLLRKIVTSSELDIDLFSKVVRVFKESGDALTDSNLITILKSLTSVGRFRECNKILKAMEETGFVPGEKVKCKIAFQLSKEGKTQEASEFLDNIEASGTHPSHQIWRSMIEGHCASGHLDKACDCFRKMIEKKVSFTGSALDILINAYCSKGRAVDAYKFLSEMVTEKEVKPILPTYKLLINKLLDQGQFKEATNVFRLMKSHGYPPLKDPFVEYIGKTGTTDDTITFLDAMTVKKLPCTDVYLPIFEAYFKAGRDGEAQEFLSKCPQPIRNHADVLNLFYSVISAKDAAASTVVAA